MRPAPARGDVRDRALKHSAKRPENGRAGVKAQTTVLSTYPHDCAFCVWIGAGRTARNGRQTTCCPVVRNGLMGRHALLSTAIRRFFMTVIAAGCAAALVACSQSQQTSGGANGPSGAAAGAKTIGVSIQDLQ